MDLGQHGESRGSTGSLLEVLVARVVSAQVGNFERLRVVGKTGDSTESEEKSADWRPTWNSGVWCSH